MLALALVISSTLGTVFSSQRKQRYFAMRHYKVEVIKTFIALEKKKIINDCQIGKDKISSWDWEGNCFPSAKTVEEMQKLNQQKQSLDSVLLSLSSYIRKLPTGI